MSFPFHRFEEFGPMSAAEKAAVTALAEPARKHSRRTLIRGEDEVPNGFFLLVQGWVTASHILRGGQRQIAKVHLPGDALDTPSMCMKRTLQELRAVTDAVTVHVPIDRFGRLFEEHPRIAAKFMLSCQLERVALIDRVASMGRTSAQESLAAFLLDLLDRLEPLGLVRDDTFVMALTQEQIADVIGLTPVHVNRTLNALEDQGLISRLGQRYRLLDRVALRHFANLPLRDLSVDPAWLPASRDGGQAAFVAATREKTATTRTG